MGTTAIGVLPRKDSPTPTPPARGRGYYASPASSPGVNICGNSRGAPPPAG